jgi:class 3 adenylate cyclase
VLNRVTDDGVVTTLHQVELGVLGPLTVRQYGLPVAVPGAKARALLTVLGLHSGSVVAADTLVELLWGDDPPRTATKALQTHISSLRRTLGDGFVLTQGTGWVLGATEVDATRYELATSLGRDAILTGDPSQAVTRFDEALTLWRGVPELPDSRRGTSEQTRWIEGHAALVEDRADALLATGRAAEIIGELEAAIADAPLRERRWGQLILALYRAGRQGEALGAFQRARSLLADELGVDPGPDLRRLESAIVAQDASLELPVSQHLSVVTRAVTFLLTDIEGSTAAWETDAEAMAVALARHDEIVEQVVTSRGGRLVKTRGEGDATFSVFDRPSAAAAAAVELQEAIRHEPWELLAPMRIRVALHTGEVELRDGDYFGRAVNRAARLRSLAAGGQILCSGATAELVIDSLADDVLLVDLGMRQLKNLARPEHVFELRLETADESRAATPDAPMERPALPAVLAGPGPFVGRKSELEGLLAAWQTTLSAGMRAVLIAGEPGVGKTRLAGEWSRLAFEQGAVVLYGRCDEDLGAPYQPFAEALRSLVPCLGASRLRKLRGSEALLPLVPGLTDVLPDLAAPTRADADTERYALFDAVVALLGVASADAPVVLILDDLHWAAKSTLLLLRHILRFGEHARVQIVGTYRSTDLDRAHPLAAMLADLHRDGSANRLQLSGLDEDDVTALVAEAGYDDEELARALASVTGGNPFFLIEALRHVDESGGRWDPSTLPQGVREAVSRRLSRLPAETNKALAAAAVVGSRFALDLVERVVGEDLVDAFDEASKAGIVIEEPGGRYRFNHAIVRQSLLAELASVRRMRLHQRIATTLESEPGADDELLAELAHHYFECAWAGNAAKAVEYCRRAADQAMARLAYEGAADLYDRALHALEELDEKLPDRDEQQAELLVARCEALLAAGDVASAAGAVSQLQAATRDSARLAAWGACFDGQLSMLTDPERLDEIEAALASAAAELAGLDDAAGEAKAHTVRAGCLARLGRIADAETALDHGLTAARRAREHRRVNAVLAGAPLAALWGPNPVPRAGGRCLDVVRLLRITTGSPVVEATSTRCQAVLDALRGRAAAGRSLLDSARRALTELGMRHALLEVDQFAGILELIADDPAAAEPHLRRACNGFRRMGLDADTAETAALLARACLALERDTEADELCTESECLAGHAFRASIAWRTVRAQLLARGGAHAEARRVAEEAVALAEHTDALVDHGDACLALATVLEIAGDGAGTRAAAEQAVGLYELKGAAALAEKARRVLGSAVPAAPPPMTSIVESDNACVRAVRRLDAALDREHWEEVEKLLATVIAVESRRKIVGLSRIDLSPSEWASEARRFPEAGVVRIHRVVVAVRGERLALIHSVLSTADQSPGAPEDELLHLMGLDGNGRIALHMSFDIEDIDGAIAELDAAHAQFVDRQPRPSLENAASRADAWFTTLFSDRRFDEIGVLFIDHLRVEDRRRGLHRVGTDRAAELAEVQALADLGVTNLTSDVIAIRGERLALVLTRANTDAPGAFYAELLRVAEVDADDRIAAVIVFDPDDFEAAIAELDARYLAGEAAAHAQTWSVITGGNAALNRRELPPVTPDCVSIDHRRGAAFAPGEMVAYLRAGIDLDQNVQTYTEVVHRLSDLGAVCTHAGHGVSHEGFDAEWRGVDLLTVDGDMVSRCEVYDEDDIDTAIAKFEQLSRLASGLENAASRVLERYLAHFPARDWDAMAELLAEDLSTDDRRRVVNAGVRRGRATEVANVKFIADIGTTNITSTPIATRGERLILARHGFSLGDWAEFNEFVDVVEINADNQISAQVVFDPEDFDAAFEELDARYLGGEAAAHAQTWSVIAGALAAVNRHELPGLTPDWVNIDHRRAIAFAPGDMTAYVRATWDDAPDGRAYIEAVHRLSNLGAIVTQVGHETSPQGFEAEWRMLNLLTVEGDRFNRSELFDDSDLDAALARFDELSRPAPQPENAASRTFVRFNAYLAVRDWDAMAELIADDACNDDRRHVVSGGIQRGRDAQLANLRAVIDVGVRNMESVTIATRGERLALTRTRVSGGDQQPEAFGVELLNIVEIDTDNRITAGVLFDLNDIGAALEELDARYLAGEAAAYANAWSAIAEAYAALNRREIPATTPDVVSIDHRRAAAFAPGELEAYVRAGWDLDQQIKTYVEAVHRLDTRGAVVSHTAHGVSHAGFDAEWRGVQILTVEERGISRAEVFDEADLDAALARFDELGRPAPCPENAVSQASERFLAQFASRDWGAMAASLTADYSAVDRRSVANAGIRRGRDAELENFRVLAGAEVDLTLTVIATRGRRLALSRIISSNRDLRRGEFQIEMLGIAELDTDGRIAANTLFDPDDVETAVSELDSRYIVGEAAAHAHTWSVVTGTYQAANMNELRLSPDSVSIDHRRARAFAPGEISTYMNATWDLAPNVAVYIESVHRLSDFGAVVTHVASGVSLQGFEAEWREVSLVTTDGDLINRTELFDEADIDAALARFDELTRRTRRLENAASQLATRFVANFTARNWDALADLFAQGYYCDDRRRVVNGGVRSGRAAALEDVQVAADVGLFTNVTSTVIATRGDRLMLERFRASGRKEPQVVQVEFLVVVEEDAANRIAAAVAFDIDDIDTAFAELDARYLAGEAADYAQTWSVVMRAYAAFNRRELPPTTPDWVNIDHRRGTAFAPGDVIPYVSAAWEIAPDINIHIEVVHRLTNLGAVVGYAANGTSAEGFDAEWREITILTMEGDLINLVELFDEADLDAALARFDELNRPAS